VTFINIYSVKIAEKIQIVFTVAKLIALLIVIGAGIYALAAGKLICFVVCLIVALPGFSGWAPNRKVGTILNEKVKRVISSGERENTNYKLEAYTNSPLASALLL